MFDNKKKDHLIFVDENKLTINIRHAPDVAYVPNAEVKGIMELAKQIRESKDKYLNEIYNPAIKKLLEKVKEYNYKNHDQYKEQIDKQDKVKVKEKKSFHNKIRKFLNKGKK